MNTIIKLIPLILSLNLSYGQTTYSEQSTDSTDSSDTNSILQNIETYLENLGSYLGYDVTAKPQSTPTDSLLDNGGSTQKQLENLTVKMYFGFINYSWSYPYFLPVSSNAYANVFNQLCGMVFKESSFTPAQTGTAIDLQYDNSSGSGSGNGSGSSNAFSKNPVSQYLYNLLFITPNDACVQAATDSNPTPNWNQSQSYSYCEGLVLANAIGLNVKNEDIAMQTTSSSQTYINTLAQKLTTLKTGAYFPTKTPSNNNINNLLQQIDGTVFMGPLMYDSSTAATSSSSSSSPQGLTTSNQLEAAQNYVRYITGGIMPKPFASYADLQSIIMNASSAKDVYTQMSYFKPLAKYMLDFRIYAARASLAVQNIYDSLAYRMNMNNSSSSDESENNTQSSQALNEYVMASYRLYNPSAQTNQTTDSTSSGEGSLKTTAWQDMINTASPPTVQKEMALLLAEINYQLYQMRQQQEKVILTNSVFLLNNLTEPTLSVPSPEDASSP